MKTIKIAILSLVVCLGITSCEFLEKEPTKVTSDDFFKNEAEAYSFLTGTYAILGQSPYYGSDYLYLIGGDDLGHFGGSGRSPRQGGLICNNANSSDPNVSAFWYTLYSGINRANIFLEQIDAVPDMNEDNRKQYKAEARALRAFFYYNLVECWGDVPFKTSSTKEVTGLAIPRTDKEVIYDFIIKELYGSANDLKSASQLAYQPGRISKSAAWGMLARAYMFRAGEHNRDGKAADPVKTKEYFKQASYYAQLVTKEGHDLVDNYWDFFIDICSNKYNNTGKNESIWEVEFAGNRSSDIRAEGRIGNIIGIPAPDLSSNSSLTGEKDPGYSYAFIYSTPKLYDLYEKNKDINRSNWNIAPFSYTQSVSGKGVDGRNFEQGKLAQVKNQYYNKSFKYGDTSSTAKIGDREKTSANKDKSRACAKYRREYESDKKSKNDTSINFPILRYADILLMIAEAENEINAEPNDLAYNYLNAIRRRAGITEITKGSLDKDAFRQAIKDERAMELCFEYTRRADLIRWGDYVRNMTELSDRARAGGPGTEWALGAENVYTYFSISSTYNYFPIPDTEMKTNSAITKNNTGW